MRRNIVLGWLGICVSCHWSACKTTTDQDYIYLYITTFFNVLFLQIKISWNKILHKTNLMCTLEIFCLTNYHILWPHNYTLCSFTNLHHFCKPPSWRLKIFFLVSPLLQAKISILKASLRVFSMWSYKKLFLTFKFSCYFFATSPIKHKTEIEISNRWETTNSKPHGSIIVIGQLKTGGSNQIMFIMLFFGKCTTLLLLLPT
jgi:hypothetical protein